MNVLISRFERPHFLAGVTPRTRFECKIVCGCVEEPVSFTGEVCNLGAAAFGAVAFGARLLDGLDKVDRMASEVNVSLPFFAFAFAVGAANIGRDSRNSFGSFSLTGYFLALMRMIRSSQAYLYR